jgi:membrane associated rhomboid family serine protease
MTAFPTGDTADGPDGVVPVCPRHPGRESYVRCQRCERPVCPECQRPAAVGVQCVDCVRAQAKTVRTARTIFGGRVTEARPVVTQSIIALCVVVFGFQWFGGASGLDVTDRFAFVPVHAFSQPWRFITSAFLHSPSFLLHILFNMYALWMLGPYLENLLGRVRFVVLYLLSAIGGSVGYFVLVPASYEYDSNWYTGAVGASGAIFGLFAALLVVNRRLGRDTSGIVGVILINAVIGFWVPNIAWQAHLGGLITGALAAAVLARRAEGDPRGRGRAQAAGLLSVLALLVAVTIVKAVTVPAGLLS